MNIQQGILEFFEACCPLSKWYVSVSKKLGQSLPKIFFPWKKNGSKIGFYARTFAWKKNFSSSIEFHLPGKTCEFLFLNEGTISRKG